ncbi:MAG: RsmD family RNA methyltransferase [Bacteroidales bacterium]|jgi:16S rRNA (guanine(966)-N(2))-methyltransferase RsmD|nr:RsmD family RNA methyltransferase [Bacteroidales bacterium]
MRIIGGSLRGRSINPPAGYKARPTTDFAKEGLFNTLGNEYYFEDLAVLDLFGGTGSISFEFASRGAGEVIAVEMNPVNAAFIKRTAATLGVGAVVQVVRHNVFDFIPLCTKRFDIVFADPPYALEGLDTIPDKVLGAGLVVPEGYLILEHPSEYNFAAHPSFVKERKYGNVHFSYFRPLPVES